MSRRTVTVCVVQRTAFWHAWSSLHEARCPFSPTLAARECAARALACADHDVVLEPIAGAEGICYRAWKQQSAGAFVGELAVTTAIAALLVLAATAGLLWLMDGRTS